MSRFGGSVVLIALSLLLAGVGTAQAATCDPTYVQVTHKHVLVLPSGGDDTGSLQCALDLGATLGPGTVVQLSAGTFHTAQLVIEGFRGAVRGMGEEQTIVQNLAAPLPIDRPCFDAGPCFSETPPSADNRYPALVSVIGTDVALSDLAFQILGTHLVEPWTMWGFPIDGFSEIVQFIGSQASLHVSRVTFDAAPIQPGDNGMWGGTATAMLMWSFSRPWNVTRSSMTVTDSTFRTGGGANAYNLADSRVTVAGNRYELLDYGSAMVVSDWKDSTVIFEHNEIAPSGIGVLGFYAWPGNLGTGINGSRLFIANNVFSGDVGILTEPGTFSGVSCLAANNDMSLVAAPYVFGESASCEVVGQQPKP